MASHRAALLLNHQNLDIQFNTAQVLSSLAEAVVGDDTEGEAKAAARPLLEEAADLFANCLAAQQRDYEQMTSQWESLQNEQGGTSLNPADVNPNVNAASGGDKNADNASETSDAPGEWATVEEALTPEVILETCTAQLNALTILLGFYDPTELSSLEKRVQYAQIFSTNVLDMY